MSHFYRYFCFAVAAFAVSLPLCAATMAPVCAARLVVKGYQLLPERALSPPTEAGVFFDPPDTATFVHAAHDLIVPASRVLNLGTGSGADSFVMGSRAAHVLAVDISPVSIGYAKRFYSRPNVEFLQFDYFSAGPLDLLKQWKHSHKPSVLVSNPPYVPCLSTELCPMPTMYGGPDGTRFVSEVINYAKVFEVPKLAFALGSYSSPLKVFRLLQEAGYGIVALTVTPIPFGSFSLANAEHLEAMEKKGEAFLWRPAGSTLGYSILGLACIRLNPRDQKETYSLADFEGILKASAKAKKADFARELSKVVEHKGVLLRILDVPN